MRFAPRILTVSLLVLSLGLHWALLQTVAWTGMIITYSRNASFQEAIAMTFGGQHPCALCKAVERGREQERSQDQDLLKPGCKLDAGLVWQATAFDFSSERDRIPPLDFFGLSRPEEPPKPRPRAIPTV